MSQTSMPTSSSSETARDELNLSRCTNTRCLTVSLITAGVIQILLGIGGIVAPYFAAIAVEILFGTIVVMVGCAELFYAWNLRTLGGSFWRYLRAACFLGTGAILLLSPLEGLMTLALVLGLAFVFDGALRVMTAAYANHRRGLLVLDGIIGMAIGGIILTGWPQDSIFIVGTVVGIRLMLSGIIALVMGTSLAVKTH